MVAIVDPSVQRSDNVDPENANEMEIFYV